MVLVISNEVGTKRMPVTASAGLRYNQRSSYILMIKTQWAEYRMVYNVVQQDKDRLQGERNPG